MKKIPTLFQRNWDTDKLVRNEVTPGCEWVLDYKGVATRKWDGACSMIRGGQLYKRYDGKNGRNPPAGFELVEADEKTGHKFGWVPVGEGPEDKYFREALANAESAWDSVMAVIPDGTYEAVGPKFNGNRDRFKENTLVQHGAMVLRDVLVRTFDGLKEYLEAHMIEGIVFYHPDGVRFSKLKRRDFGFRW